MTLGYKNIGIRNTEFVAKTQILLYRRKGKESDKSI